MSGENSSSTQKFPADFKKVAGMITLTPTHVAWVPNVAGTMDRQNQAMNRVISVFFPPYPSPDSFSSIYSTTTLRQNDFS